MTRPLETCAPVGTPAGLKRKKSALTPPTTSRVDSRPRSSSVVVLRPTALRPPFTATVVRQRSSRRSITWIAHGPVDEYT